MHPLPRRILHQLLKDFGRTILNDPARLDALLADLWGAYHCERFLLFHAAKLLSTSRDSAGYGHHIPQTLQRRYGFSSEAAQWATESWFEALDLGPSQRNISRSGSHTEFSHAPQIALRRLLTDYGPALLEDPARVHALLADLGELPVRERFLLVHALRENIPAELLVQHLDDRNERQQLSQRFQRKYGLSTEAARWAIESWSLSIVVAQSGQDSSLKVKREAAKAVARHLATEREAAKAVARQKKNDLKAAETVARQKKSDLAAAETVARQKAYDLDAARKEFWLKARAARTARQKGEAVKEVIVQILELNPLTPGEVGEIFGVSEEQAVTWLGQLEGSGKIEEILLRRRGHYPAGFQVKGWSYTTVVATDEKKRAVGVAARKKVKEWRATELVARKSERARAAAVSHVRQVARERSSAVSKVHQVADERDAAETKAQRLAKECAEADSAARQSVNKLAAAKIVVQQLGKRQAAADRAARLKSKEWSSAAATARKMVEKRTEAEARARLAEKRSSEIVLKELRRSPLTSREVAAILKTEQEQVIGLLKRLLSDNQIEITWSERLPYTPCYQPVKHASTPTVPKDQSSPRPSGPKSSDPPPKEERVPKDRSSPRPSGCMWLLALPGLLGLVALLG